MAIGEVFISDITPINRVTGSDYFILNVNNTATRILTYGNFLTDIQGRDLNFTGNVTFSGGVSLPGLGNVVRTFNGRGPNAAGNIRPQADDYSLNQLADVNITNANTNDILTLNSLNQWVAAPPPSGGGGGGASELNDLSDVSIAGTPSDDDVLTFRGGSWIQSDLQTVINNSGITIPGSSTQVFSVPDNQIQGGGIDTALKLTVQNIHAVNTFNEGDVVIVVNSGLGGSNSNVSYGSYILDNGTFTLLQDSKVSGSLIDFDDVNISSLSNQDVLYWYDDGVTSEWRNIPFKLNSLFDVNTTSLTGGQVLIWNDTTSTWTPGTITGGGGGSLTYTFRSTDNSIVFTPDNTDPSNIIIDAVIDISNLQDLP